MTHYQILPYSRYTRSLTSGNLFMLRDLCYYGKSTLALSPPWRISCQIYSFPFSASPEPPLTWLRRYVHYPATEWAMDLNCRSITDIITAIKPFTGIFQIPLPSCLLPMTQIFFPSTI